MTKKFTKQSSSCGNQLRLDEIIEDSFQGAPRRGERTPRRNIFGQSRVECSQTRSEHSAVGFGEEHGNSSSESGELVSACARELADKAFTFQSAQIISRLSGGVGRIEQRRRSPH